jgi:transglutaminase-like putative cysteine protease
MYYSIRHTTEFKYSAPISESVMEVRTQPRNEGPQRCISAELVVQPKAHVMTYIDFLGNMLHTFDVPRHHAQLKITARAIVEMGIFQPLPESLDVEAWDELDAAVVEKDFWDLLSYSHLTEPTPLLHDLAARLNVQRRTTDPLSMLRVLNADLFQSFEYKPQTTQVDSPIDDALSSQAGVCQDFAHIMLALVRELKIPARYVSGYLYHQREAQDRSEQDATHAWIEAWLPRLGWIGFDPTNNLIAGSRHIRVAVGRDYGDVPPTKGVFKGKAESELNVSVQVTPLDELPADVMPPLPQWEPPANDLPFEKLNPNAQQQQQQQQ